MKKPVTHIINEKALEIISSNPEGIRWVDLLKQIQASDPSLHPKTINGCVWKLAEKYPDKVYKPAKGVFKLLKYEDR